MTSSNELSNWKKERLTYTSSAKKSEINLDLISDSTHQTEDLIVYREGSTCRIYDRKCDHNNGRLSVKEKNKAVCPLHGWKLDLTTGQYLTANCSKKPLLIVDDHELDSPIIEVPIINESLDLLDFNKKYKFKVEFINHACLYFELNNGLKFATDPWIIGSAFNNGWWLKKRSPINIFEKLNDCDFIYISHNHPDHLHFLSLSNIRKNIPIVTAGFKNESVVGLLKDNGFTEIIEMDFASRLTHRNEEVSIAVLKSGDFRDDSGLLVEIGEFKCLLTVDSNFLNFGKLPKDIDLLCSSFSGGASGFPLCFETYSEDEKHTILKRNSSAIKATNRKNIELTTPSYFMPYAGFFEESATRDSYIKESNIKNSIADYNIFSKRNSFHLLNCDVNQIFKFSGKKLISEYANDSEKIKIEDVDSKIEEFKISIPNIPDEDIINYFLNSNFKDELIVKIELVSDDFNTTYRDFSISFSTEFGIDANIGAYSDEFYIREYPDKKFLRMKIREHEFYSVLINGGPWEDLSIGFQSRIFRHPNIYNNEFWYHFTNVYIGSRTSMVAQANLHKNY